VHTVTSPLLCMCKCRRAVIQVAPPPPPAAAAAAGGSHLVVADAVWQDASRLGQSLPHLLLVPVDLLRGVGNVEADLRAKSSSSSSSSSSSVIEASAAWLQK
jgi:hypothetical protein